MKNKNLFEEAYNYSIKLLKLRNRTENEIKNKLENKGYSIETINLVIKKLKSYFLLDDKKFIDKYFEKEIKKCKNINLIIAELRNKYNIKEDLLNNIDINYYQKKLLKNIFDLIKKKYNFNLKKIQNFLLSKGFDYNDIENIINLYKENILDDNNR